MSYDFTTDQLRKLRERFGDDFLPRLQAAVTCGIDRWQLTELQFIESYSVNCNFTCVAREYGDAVMKLGDLTPEALTEWYTLEEYDGNRFCKAYDIDLKNGVLLEERILPGIRLREEPSLERRVEVFLGLYESLHKTTANPARFPAYLGWVDRITEFMLRREDYPELTQHMRRARELCRSLWERYSARMLLHGDFHHDNILMGGDGYRIIDPKGVVGDPIFDLPRFILNEFDDAVTDAMGTRIPGIIAMLHDALDIPAADIAACLYIETAMANCWNVESGEPPELECVRFAEELTTRV